MKNHRTELMIVVFWLAMITVGVSNMKIDLWYSAQASPAQQIPMITILTNSVHSTKTIQDGEDQFSKNADAIIRANYVGAWCSGVTACIVAISMFFRLTRRRK